MKIKTGYKKTGIKPQLIWMFNHYKNSSGIIKIILKSNQIIRGKSDDQPRIGDYILANFINLSWS